jgi:hypothetical protein
MRWGIIFEIKITFGYYNYFIILLWLFMFFEIKIAFGYFFAVGYIAFQN